MSNSKRLSLGLTIFIAALASALVIPLPGRTCGRFFPNRMLMGGDEGALWTPLTTFNIEITKIKPLQMPPFKAKVFENEEKWRYVTPGQYRADALRQDLEDLEAALRGRGLPEGERERIVLGYGAARKSINIFACYKDASEILHFPFLEKMGICQEYIDEPFVPCIVSGSTEEIPRLESLIKFGLEDCPGFDINASPRPVMEAPPGTPEEFALYLRAAGLYYQNQWAQAREQWQMISDLPSGDRHYKSVWAAFMMGKTLFETDPAQAVEWFGKARKLATAGYADGLGLTAETYFWEAKAAYDRKDYVAAIEFLITLRATGYDHGQHYLRLCSSHILDGGTAEMAAAARHRTARQVVSAYVSSYYNPNYDPKGIVEKWLAVVERSKSRDVLTADLLAWTAYQNGRFNLCQRWLDRGSNLTPLSLWLRAKLAMRAGNFPRAERLLQKAAAGFPVHQRWANTVVPPSIVFGWEEQIGITADKRVLAELGMVRLKLGRFVPAMDAFARAGQVRFGEDDYWLDAVYVAERVLTIDELTKYVDRNWKDPGPIPSDLKRDERIKWERPVMAQRIRYVLARRLTRLGRWREARPYYPENIRPVLDSYFQLLKRGRDRRLAFSERIEAFWQAGDMAREQGGALMEIEIETDWMISRSSKGWESDLTSQARLPRSSRQLLGATAAERRRVQRHTNEAGVHFHYYYVALDHYRSAIALMPPDTEETARRTCEAGRWIRYRDPQAADYFYKLLVRRNWSTPLARQADALRWFPNCTEANPQ